MQTEKKKLKGTKEKIKYKKERKIEKKVKEAYNKEKGKKCILRNNFTLHQNMCKQFL